MRFVLLFALCAAPAAADSRARADKIEVELVAATTGFRPGSKVRVGVIFRPDEDWHVYWRNEGDSGLPPTIEPNLPAGVRAGPVQWPAPHRHVMPGDIVVFAYEGAVLLPFEVTVPADFAGDSLTISAKVGWLVCHDDHGCIPGEAALSLTLAAAPGGPSPDPAHADAFARAADAMPRPLPEGAVWFTADAERVTLRIDHARLGVGDAAGPPVFFPFDSAEIGNGEQSFGVDDGKWRLSLPREGEFSRLRGVMTAGGQAFELDLAPGAPIPPAAAGRGGRPGRHWIILGLPAVVLSVRLVASVVRNRA
jgi:thiol:disulfide interchange protein DsbD